MKAAIVKCPFGILAFNKENKLIEKKLFPKKPQIAAEVLMKIEAGRMVDEFVKLITVLQKIGYDSFVFENVNLAKEVQKRLGVKVQVSKVGGMLRSRMEGFAVETGFVRDAEEFN
ncbi:hypothetical protein KAU55_06185, partial [Candidatus Bathyarchaeota archaeon]|nr:hypothetical protein [Candidatus Bathyarchaeota archaeon]